MVSSLPLTDRVFKKPQMEQNFAIFGKKIIFHSNLKYLSLEKNTLRHTSDVPGFILLQFWAFSRFFGIESILFQSGNLSRKDQIGPKWVICR